jgi:hypothetical protein
MSKFTANGLVCFSPRSTFTRRANTDWQGSNKLLASGNNEAEHSMLGSLLFVSCHIQQFQSIPLPVLAFWLYCTSLLFLLLLNRSGGDYVSLKRVARQPLLQTRC